MCAAAKNMTYRVSVFAQVATSLAMPVHVSCSVSLGNFLFYRTSYLALRVLYYSLNVQILGSNKWTLIMHCFGH
jgi:hypothetical protein